MKKIYNEMFGCGEIVRETETHFYVRFDADPWVIHKILK
jgi:hypothetical protein